MADDADWSPLLDDRSQSPVQEIERADRRTTKRRRIGMRTSQCFEYTSSAAGSQPLVNPVATRRSSRHPNIGLHPRTKGIGPKLIDRNVSEVKASSAPISFRTASQLLNSQSHSPFSSSVSLEQQIKSPSSSQQNRNLAKSQTNEPVKWSRYKQSLPVQKNKLFNYFSVSPRKVSTTQQFPPNVSIFSVDQLPPSSKSVAEKNTMSAKRRPHNPIIREVIDEDEVTATDSDLEIIEVCYGLIGDERQLPPKTIKDAADQPGTNFISRLPLHVMENIFSQLPIVDLCLQCNSVSKDWMQIISNNMFCVWKKRYHRLKANVESVSQHLLGLMVNHQMDYPSQFLLGLIKYMANFKPITSSNMNECLSSHTKYHWVCRLFEERITECIQYEKPNPWSCIACLVLLSECVSDVTEVLVLLLGPNSLCTRVEVIECLYCIATFLLMFCRRKHNAPWHGIHYRLFYALYLQENAFPMTVELLKNVFDSSGQQNIMKYSEVGSPIRMTHEQLRIVNHNMQPGEVVKIVAFAGTGKTTTLVRFSQLRPDKRFLMIVFNKSVQEQAVKKFPQNVDCRTVHSLAFAKFGRRYTAAKKLKPYALKVFPVSQSLHKSKPRRGENLFIRAKFVVDTVIAYMSSAEQNIATCHVPDFTMDDEGKKVHIDHVQKMKYVEDAELIWQLMIDYNDQFGITHDGYLKLYQLSKPRLNNYDYILIDEAQDLTPAVTDIIMNQQNAKILVGDPRQQIYAFRGAVNAMALIQGTKIFYLTQSFRFGPEIAYVASCCLEVLHAERRRTLVGGAVPGVVGGTVPSVVGGAVPGVVGGAVPGGGKGVELSPVTIISRTNFTMFSEAVRKTSYEESTNMRIAFVGGIQNFGLDIINDIYLLSLPSYEREDKRIKSEFIGRFDSFGELQKYAKKAMDAELLGKIKIVLTYHSTLPSCISKIKSKLVNDERTADFVFTTAHKAKGLEFTTVKLSDDFLMTDFVTSTEEELDEVALAEIVKSSPVDERNLLYVAVTRAKKRLLLSQRLLTILKMCGEDFRFPVLSDNLATKLTKHLKSTTSGVEFLPNCLTLVRKPHKTADGVDYREEIYSPTEVSQFYPAYHDMLGYLTKQV